MDRLTIVGGGIIGIVAAYQAMLSHPETPITIIDRGEFGRGASQYAAALSSTLASLPIVAQDSRESDRFYQELRAADPTLPMRTMPLVYILDRDPEFTTELTTIATTRPTIPIQPQDSRLNLAFVDLERTCLLYEPEALHIEPLAMIEAIVAKLRARSNITLLSGETVTGIRSSDSSAWQLELGSGQSLPTDRILWATGAWSVGHRATRSSLASHGRVKKIVTMQVDVPPPEHCPVLFFVDDDAFLLPHGDHFLFSIRSTHWDVSPDDRLSVSDADRGHGHALLARYAPTLLSGYRDRDVFCDCYSDDGAPIVRLHDTEPGVVIATGGCGRGVRLAPAIARRALDLLGYGSASYSMA